MNANRSALPKLVYGIVQKQPSGLKHAEVVRELRRRGIVYGPGFSAVVHEILTEFVTCGAIVRNQNELLERRYKAVAQEMKACPYEDAIPHRNRLVALTEEFA